MRNGSITSFERLLSLSNFSKFLVTFLVTTYRINKYFFLYRLYIILIHYLMVILDDISRLTDIIDKLYLEYALRYYIALLTIYWIDYIEII